jgi:hypothetical protein
LSPELLEASITNALTQADGGLTVAMPIHLHGNHWCSLVIKMRDDANGKKFIAVFNNPTGEAVEGEPNVTNFIMHLQKSSKALGAIEPTIIDLRYSQQTNDDDCGPFVVDNLVKLSRLDELENLEAAGAILNIANLSHGDATGIREVHRVVLVPTLGDAHENVETFPSSSSEGSDIPESSSPSYMERSVLQGLK